MKKIGHRGAKGYVAENTLASIQKALDFGVDGIEIDVHLCASGELVVFHDITLDRITNGSGDISKFTLSELKKMKVLSHFEIPTLEEVLLLINKKCFLNIELKGKHTVSETSRIIDLYVHEKGWKYDDFLVSSFRYSLLNRLYKINKKIPIGVLTDISLKVALAVAKKTHAVSINPDYTMLTKEKVSKLKMKGFKVYTWTVNEKSTIDLMKSYGVDGIISDFPDRL